MQIEESLVIAAERDSNDRVGFVLYLVCGDWYVVVPDFVEQCTSLRNYLSHQLIK